MAPGAEPEDPLKPTESNLARRVTSGSQEREGLAVELTMFRSGKSAGKLEVRHSDPLEPADSLTPVEWEREPILNLVTAVLSNCVLGFPFCFKACGLGLAVLLVLVTLAAAELSMRLLLMSSQLTGKRSYEELARHAFGWWGHFAVQCSLVALNVGSVVSYLLILTDTVSSVAGTVIPPGAEPSRNMMLALITLCGCLPVAVFVKSAQLLNGVNTVSMAFLLFFCCIIALLPFWPTYTGHLLWWRWEGVLVAFPIVSYGFTAHQYLFQIYSPTQRPTMKKMTTAMQRGMVLSAVIYVIVGACGYSAFGSRTAGDVLRNFGGMGASGVRLYAERVLKYGFGLSLLGAIPLTLYPLHDTFAPWLVLCSPVYTAAMKQAEAAGLSKTGMQLSQLQHSLLTAGILGASFALAVLLPNVEFVFGLAGSTASTLMAFILPAAIFLSVSGGQRGLGGHSVDMLRGSSTWRQRRRMAGALLFFGCVAGVLCTHALVVSIQEENEVVQLAQELVREEVKVAAAAHTEAKAKQVVEVVAEVARAKQEVEVVKQEASGQAETLTRTAQALNTSVTAGGWRERQEQKGKATTDLAEAQGRADQAVAKLENVTASLGATASRMRNETAAAKAAPATDAGQGQQQPAQQQPAQQQPAQQQPAQQQQQQQQQQQGSKGQHAGSAAHEGVVQAAKAAVATLVRGNEGDGSTSGGAVAAHEGMVRAAETAVAQLTGAKGSGGGKPGEDGPDASSSGGIAGSASSSSSASNGTSGEAGGTAAAAVAAAGAKPLLHGGDKDAAEALEKAAGAANETLHAVKESKAALEAAAVEAATKGKTKKETRELGKAISQALNATTEAQARLNATAAALDEVEKEKKSELLGLVQRLAEEDEKEEREAEKRAAIEARTHGRRTGPTDGANGAASTAAAASAAAYGGSGGRAGAAAGNSTSAAGGRPRAEVREALKQAAAAGSAGELSELNVTAVAQVAIEAASTVMASSKEKVEEAIEKKKPKVSERAIEIAKEMVGGGGGAAAGAAASATPDAAGSNATTPSGGAAVVSALEMAATKQQQLANSTQQRTLAVLPSVGAGARLRVAAVERLLADGVTAAAPSLAPLKAKRLAGQQQSAAHPGSSSSSSGGRGDSGRPAESGPAAKGGDAPR